MFYSRSTNGFYDEEIHGPRRISIVSPSWERPRTDVVLQPGESRQIDGKKMTNTGDEPITLGGVPDMNASPEMIEVDNPDCKIPVDAKEISKDHYAALLQGQSEGKRIIGDHAGYPELVTPPPVPFPELAALFMAEVRATRQKILGIIMQIGWAADKQGDATMVAAVLAARDALLGITETPAVLAASQREDYEGLRTAVKAEYKAIVGAAPESLRKAFNEVSQ